MIDEDNKEGNVSGARSEEADAAENKEANASANPECAENAEASDTASGGAAEETGGDSVADRELDAARAEAAKYKESYIRTLADFDNFRKRTIRDREDTVKQAAADVVKSILPAVDNFERALAQSPAGDSAAEFVKGVRLTYEGLLSALAQNGATPVESLGKPFDPNVHEAMGKMASQDIPADSIAVEIRKAWLLHGKLLRSAQVIVSTGPEA